MRILVIGGTGITGPHTVQFLLNAGHDVTVFNRGHSQGTIPKGVQRITGDKSDLSLHREELHGLQPDVVLHMAAFRRDETREFMELFDGHAGRVVGISSMDVYAAYARLKRSEVGPLQPVPIGENAELRRTIQPQGEEYDKLGVEDELSSKTTLPATILRFPGIYGPRDGLRRLYPYLKRMDDGRPFILIDDKMARFRFSRAYSENAAFAVSQAVMSETARGRVYNVAEPETFAEGGLDSPNRRECRMGRSDPLAPTRYHAE